MSPGNGAPVVLLDTMGELASLYAVADVIFVGGSLVPVGGHNVVEPALHAKAVVFGPHMTNFRDAAALLLRADAAIQVEDAAALAATLRRLLRRCARPPGARASGVERRARAPGRVCPDDLGAGARAGAVGARRRVRDGRARPRGSSR